MTALEPSSRPYWTRYVELILELGIGRTNTSGAAVGSWDRSHWSPSPADGGVWSGLEPEWFRIDPCDILDLSITRGRERWIERFGASSATMTLLDADGSLSWAFEDDTVPTRIARPVRISALIIATGEILPLWRGWIEGLDDSFEPGAIPTVTLTAQDGFAQTAHVDLPEIDPPVGAGERSDERIARLLDLADWPKVWRNLEQGVITVQATNLARAIADDLGITADSEGGALYSDRNDHLVFRNRDWLRTDPHAVNTQAIIGGPDHDFCASSYGSSRQGDDIVNDVQMARAGGTMRRFVDDESVALYRRRVFSRSDFVCQTDAQIDLLAQRLLSARSRAQLRIPTVVLEPNDDPAFWRFVCAVDYGWRLELNYEPQTVTSSRALARAAGGWSREVQVQGIDYRISSAGWEVTLKVDDARESAVDTWDGPRGWDLATWGEAA